MEIMNGQFILFFKKKIKKRGVDDSNLMITEYFLFR